MFLSFQSESLAPGSLDSELLTTKVTEVMAQFAMKYRLDDAAGRPSHKQLVS